MTHTELFPQFVAYHQGGDANVEGRCIANICDALSLSEYDRFRLCYYYATCYNIDSALRLLENPTLRVDQVVLRTDRRYVRCNGAYDRILKELDENKFRSLKSCKTTSEAVRTIEKWYYFGRYASFLFGETYLSVFSPKWRDDIIFDWSQDDNHILGAKTLIVERDNGSLNSLIAELKQVPTRFNNSNSLAIETGLCGWWKILKGTRWNGFYAERMMNEALESKFRDLILSCAD